MTSGRRVRVKVWDPLAGMTGILVKKKNEDAVCGFPRGTDPTSKPVYG